LAVKINGNRGAQQETLFQQKFQKILYYVNRNSQFRSMMYKMIQLDIRRRSRTKKSDSDSTQKPPTAYDSAILITKRSYLTQFSWFF